MCYQHPQNIMKTSPAEAYTPRPPLSSCAEPAITSPLSQLPGLLLKVDTAWSWHSEFLKNCSLRYVPTSTLSCGQMFLFHYSSLRPWHSPSWRFKCSHSISIQLKHLHAKKVITNNLPSFSPLHSIVGPNLSSLWSIHPYFINWLNWHFLGQVSQVVCPLLGLPESHPLTRDTRRHRQSKGAAHSNTRLRSPQASESWADSLNALFSFIQLNIRGL